MKKYIQHQEEEEELDKVAVFTLLFLLIIAWPIAIIYLILYHEDKYHK